MNSPSRKSFLNWASIILWSFLFAVAYAQSPLYTSNQNQYFLHGLANAGYGNLSGDWLASTRDPAPIFSLLVEVTYRTIPQEGIFYLYYAALMGIYLFSLYGIASTIFQITSSKTRSLLFLALIIAVHSAALRFTLSRLVGVNWAYVLEDGVADQRILGPVLQPSAFGVLLILSIYLFLKEKDISAVLLAALAAIIHPTYLLASGVLTLSYMVITWHEQRRLKRSLIIGSLAFLCVSPMLVYSWNTFGSGSAEVISAARQILVEFRIPHHTQIRQWLDATVLVKLLLLGTGIYLVRGTRLFWVLCVSTSLALVLTTIQAITKSNALALLFPWRLSTYLIPIATTVWIAFLVDKLLGLPVFSANRWQRAFRLIALVIIFLSVMAGGVRFILDLQRKIKSPERLVETYIYAHSSADAVYLIPVKLQDFRLAAGASAYVDFKSIPYQDDEVLEWYRREQLADRFYKTLDCQILEDMVSEGEVTHVLVEAGQVLDHCPGLVETYQDPFYTIYQISRR